MPEEKQPLKPDITKPIPRKKFERTAIRRGLGKVIDEDMGFTIMNPPGPYEPTEKYLNLREQRQLPQQKEGFVPASGDPNVPSDFVETDFQPGEDWDWRNAERGPDNEPLPRGATAWTPLGQPYYGEGLSGAWNKMKSAWQTSVERGQPGTETFERKQEALEEAEGVWEKAKVNVKHNKMVDMLRLTWAAVEGGLNLAEEVVERPVTTASMVMEDMAQYSNWKPITTKHTDILDEAGWPGPGNFLERISPIRWVYNMARTMEAAISGNKDWEFDEVVDLWKTNYAASRMGWGIGAGEQAYRAEFAQRVADGENPDLVAMDMERPFAELVGRALFDAIWIVQGISKASKFTGQIDEVSDFLMKGVPEIGEVVASKGDEATSVLRASKYLDEVAEGLAKADSRIVKETVTEANKFGLFKELGTTRRNKAAIDSGLFGQWVASVKKDPEEVTEIFRALARSASNDIDEKKRGIAFLTEAFRNPEPVFSEGGRKFATLMNKIFTDDGVFDAAKFADEFLEVQKAGNPQAAWRFIGTKIEGAINDTYPLLDEAIQAGGDVSPAMRALARVEDSPVGAVKRFVNQFSGRAYVGMNPPVAVRGGIYDLFQSVVDTDITVLSKTPGKWADVSVRWLQSEHPGLTKGFSKADIQDLENLIKADTGYKDLPSFFEAIKGGEDLSAMDRLSLPGARLLERMEISSSQRIIGKATDDAMKKILRADGTFKNTDELIQAGLSQKIAESLRERIISNYGDVDAVRNDLMRQLSSGTVSNFESGSWLSNDARRLVDEFGVSDEFYDAIKGKENLREALESVFKIKDDMMAKTENLAKQHVQMVIDNINDPKSVASVNEALYELVEQGAPLQDLAEDLLNKSNDLWKIDRLTQNAWGQAGEDILYQLRLHYESLGDEGSEGLRAISRIRSSGVLDNIGGKFGEVTGRNQVLMDDVAKYTERLSEAKPSEVGAIIAEAEEVFGIDNLPKDKKAINALWDIMRGDRQASEFMKGRKAAFGEFQNYLDVLRDTLPDNAVDDILASSQKVERAQLLERLATQFDNSIMVNGELKPAGEYIRALLQSGDNKNAVRVLAQSAKLNPSTSAASDLFDGDILYNLNRFGVDADNLDDVKIEDAFNALQEWRNSKGLSRQAESLEELLGAVYNSKIPDNLSPITRSLEAYKRTGTLGSDDMRELVRFVNNNGLGNDIADIRKAYQNGSIDDVANIAQRVQDNLMRYIADEGGAMSTKRATDEMIHWLKRAGIEHDPSISQMDGWKLLYKESPGGVPSLVPPFDDSAPTEAMNIWHRKPEIEAMFTKIAGQVRDNFGKVVPQEGVSDDLIRVLDNWLDDAASKVGDARLMSGKYAQGMRDFVLHDYANRYGFDTALSYLFNFHFWPSRTAAKWMTQRVFNNPALISAYMNYREYMQNIHADAPDWWKGAINTNELLAPLGVEMDNPLFFRLESLIQPIYLMAGSDFTDDRKRVNWWTTVIDDIGKVAPGYWNPLINFAVATSLAAKEEKDASARWAGRLLPATSVVQSLTSIMGIKGGKGLEIDPAIQIYSGGIGPYEKNRIAKTLAGFVRDGTYTEEEIIDAAYNHSGEAWDAAIVKQRQTYGKGNIVSFFSGINTRQRTQADMEADSFWSDYMRMWSLSADMSSEELRYNMEKMRDAYPMMDALLLGRKGKEQRDSAYAWSVLSRIKPGKTDDLSRALGLPYDIVGKFYEDKGDMADWKKTDKSRFVSAVIDMGASLELPDSPTRNEWTAASVEYSRMVERGEEIFGDDIWDAVDYGYAVRKTGINSSVEYQKFLEANPIVESALQWRDRYILENTLLSAYYGGQEKLRDYYKGVMYQEIEDELGSDVWDSWSVYYSLVNTGQKEEAKAYMKQHPELEKYRELKKEGLEDISKNMLEYGEKLPRGQDMRLRQAVEEQSVGEQQVREFVAQPQTNAYTTQEWVEIIGAEETQLAKLAYEGFDLPPDIVDQLEEQALAMDMTLDELLISIGTAQ